MTYRYVNPVPFVYEEALFFLGMSVRFSVDSRFAVPNPISFDFEEAFSKAGDVLIVLAIHDYGQGCLLALSDGKDFVWPVDRDDFFSHFSPANLTPSRAND